MPLQRQLRLIASSERAKRQRQRVVRGSPFRKERDRLLDFLNRLVVLSFECRNPPEPEQRFGSGLRFPQQRREHRPAFLDLTRVQERVGKLDTRWQIVGPDRERFTQPRGGVHRTRETFEHARIEIPPVEFSRCKGCGARIGLVGGVPLFPRMEQARERSYGDRVGRTGPGIAICRCDGLTHARRIRVERQDRKRGC